MKIFHLIDRKQWQSVKKSKQDYCPESLKDQGFVHCSKADQLLDVANAFFKHVNELLILTIDSEKLREKLVFEPPFETPFATEKFPHIYGPLNLDSVVKETLMERNDNGKFYLPKKIF